MIPLESPRRSDSNYIQYTIFNMNRKNTLNYPKSEAMGFFQGAQERFRTASVRAIEILLYMPGISLVSNYIRINIW